MKNENILILVIVAVVAIFLLRRPTAAATINSAAGVNTRTLPDNNNNVDASDLIGIARDSLAWASRTFGGWGNDMPSGTSEVDPEAGVVANDL